MGTWGPHNFENDGANDYLVELLMKLIGEIRNTMSPKNLQNEAFLEDFGEYQIIPAIDVFITLSEKYHIPTIIDADTAAQWKKDYLLAYDTHTAIFKGDFRNERRKAIVETFDRLDNLIKEWDI